MCDPPKNSQIPLPRHLDRHRPLLARALPPRVGRPVLFDSAAQDVGGGAGRRRAAAAAAAAEGVRDAGCAGFGDD